MTMQSITDLVVPAVHRMKEHHVALVPQDAPLSATDVQGMVDAWRGDHLIASCVVMGGRDNMLNVARIAASGFAADVLAWTIETWHRGIALDAQENPVTGEPLENGDLEDLVANHQGLEKGWVSAALHTMVFNRAGDLAVVMQPYRMTRTRTGWEIEWKDEERLLAGEDGTVGGFVVEELAHTMSDQVPTLVQLHQKIEEAGMIPPGFADWSFTRRAAYFDALCVKGFGMLRQREVLGDVALMLADNGDPERARALMEFLNEDDGVDGMEIMEIPGDDS